MTAWKTYPILIYFLTKVKGFILKKLKTLQPLMKLYHKNKLKVLSKLKNWLLLLIKKIKKARFKLIIIKIFDKIKTMARSLFIKDKIKLYKTLKPCLCPAIQEIVSFTSDGLHHLLYDNNKRRPRSHDEQHYRAGIIPCLHEIVSSSTKATKEVKSESPLLIIWSLFYEVTPNNRKQIVRVDLMKKGNGSVKFLSTRRKKYIKKYDKN